MDDIGKKKVVTKRGIKYPENIKNISKTSFSIMMCGNATGDLLPPFVVYKALHMWDWINEAPPGCYYSCTSSGWFDSKTFEEWFRSLMLPALRKQTGKKGVDQG
ncbi:hypothetical protein AVEN_102482-1 [Araneus ventricosus]|uniref:DDE-1 domain-containing protein n=1 Tax=Araneus ventricosus TaxID=182803 RepID=A0A4Y2H7N5_ARAVE|nr:hypothetical protein AVEN_102482-1 [Araneus ventricosus]